MKELQAMAAANGLRYRGQDGFRDLPPFALLSNGLGGNPGLYHFVEGERDGGRVYFCDAHLGINGAATLYRAVAILQAPDLDLPHFVAHPHG